MMLLGKDPTTSVRLCSQHPPAYQLSIMEGWDYVHGQVKTELSVHLITQ